MKVSDKDSVTIKGFLTTRQYEVWRLLLMEYSPEEITKVLFPPVKLQQVKMLMKFMENRLIKHKVIHQYKAINE